MLAIEYLPGSLRHVAGRTDFFGQIFPTKSASTGPKRFSSVVSGASRARRRKLKAAENGLEKFCWKNQKNGNWRAGNALILLHSPQRRFRCPK